MKDKSKIKDQKSKISKNITNNAGFTLVEIMVVLAILIFIGAIIGSIVMSILRGTNKTNTLTMVRQNGSYAVSQMSKMLRNAKTFGGLSETGASYTSICNSDIQYKYIKIKSFDEGETTFSCCTDTIASLSAGLTCSDNNKYSLLDTANAVELQDCYFTCNQNSITDSPDIGINFSLKAKTSGVSLAERQASESAIPFNTSVILRNVGR